MSRKTSSDVSRENVGLEQKETSGGVSKKYFVVVSAISTIVGMFGKSAPHRLVGGRVGCALRMMKKACVVVHGGFGELWCVWSTGGYGWICVELVDKCSSGYAC